MPIYEKSTRELMFEMVDRLGIRKGDVISRDQVVEWFTTNFPKIKKGTVTAHLLRMSTNAPSRVHYHRTTMNDDLFYQLDSKHFVLYDKEKHPQPITRDSPTPTIAITPDENSDNDDSREFAYEKDLQNFLSKNLEIIETGLRLYEDEGISGIEYPVGGRFIDILAVDRNNALVVIELKVSRGYDRVVGQLLRYVNWIKRNLAESDQLVRGIIIAREITEDLLMACDGQEHIELHEYQMSVTLRKVAHGE